MIKFFILTITTLLAMTAYSQSNCINTCSSECLRLAESITGTCARQIDSGSGPQLPASQRTTLFNSDNCSSNPIAFLTANVDCSKLTTSTRTYGISVRGQCHNISDINTASACRLYKAANNTDAYLLYVSDRCEVGQIVAAVDTNSNCSELASSSSNRVYGIKIDGQCFDIRDQSISTACETIKAGGIPN